MAEHLWAPTPEREWESRAGRERDLSVSFAFLVDWSPSVVWLWERTHGKCSLTAGVRLLLDKIICGSEEVALFVCACVFARMLVCARNALLLGVCFFSLNVCLIEMPCCTVFSWNAVQHRSCFWLAHWAPYGQTQEEKDREACAPCHKLCPYLFSGLLKQSCNGFVFCALVGVVLKRKRQSTSSKMIIYLLQCSDCAVLTVITLLSLPLEATATFRSMKLLPND